ncbi:SLC13 family permease [Blattabacterium cuenoti]|uniref:SLC13 family permease n=1 Tax=Blattabacterium cuenoti TaxID=1653831 RepID=UPI00163CCB32|nr:SLC13 family permease [Blattabacterium cuenoti]
MVVLIFFIGYLFIIFGNIISINKIIPSILMAIICWSLIIYLNLPVYELSQYLIRKDPNNLLLLYLGKTSEIIFFLIGAMLIISILDEFFAFEALKELFYTDTKRKFLWKLSITSFLLSAIIDNLTASIVLISLLRKTIPNYKERLYYLGLIIISANSGGVWSPIGDITTTMLWISKKVTIFYLLKKVFIPSLICMIVSTCIISNYPIFNGNIYFKKNKLSINNIKEGFFMLKIGSLLMILVPIYKIIIGIPPYMGMMFSLGVLLCICLIKHGKKFNDCIDDILKKLDLSGILFFFGILLSISSMESLGILYNFSNWINNVIYEWKITSFIFGLISSMIDNIPLVAATISMFSYSYFIDHDIWHYIAYVSGTGGSLLLIGSAAGVAAMGLEKIDFIWYLKKISWIALIGYISGFIYLIL